MCLTFLNKMVCYVVIMLLYACSNASVAAGIEKVENLMQQTTLGTSEQNMLLDPEYWFRLCYDKDSVKYDENGEIIEGISSNDIENLERIFRSLNAPEKRHAFFLSFFSLTNDYFLSPFYKIKLLILFYRIPAFYHSRFIEVMQGAPFILDSPLSDGGVFYDLACFLKTINASLWPQFVRCLNIFNYFDLFFKIPIFPKSFNEKLSFVHFYNYSCLMKTSSIPATGNYRCRNLDDLESSSLRYILKSGKDTPEAQLNAIYDYLKTPKDKYFAEEKRIYDFVLRLFFENGRMDAHFNLEGLASDNNIPIKYFKAGHDIYLQRVIKYFLARHPDGYTISDVEELSNIHFIPQEVLYKNSNKLIQQIVCNFYDSHDEDEYLQIENFLSSHPQLPRERFLGALRAHQLEVESRLFQQVESQFSQQNEP